MDYKEWLNYNEYDEGVYHGNSIIITKKDGTDFEDDNGKHPAMSNEALYNAAYDQSRDDMMDEMLGTSYNLNIKGPTLPLFLNKEEIRILLEIADNSKVRSAVIEERLKNAKEAFEAWEEDNKDTDKDVTG